MVIQKINRWKPKSGKDLQKIQKTPTRHKTTITALLKAPKPVRSSAIE